MKTVYFALLATLAGLTVGQNGLPTCAQTCVDEYTTGSQIAGCTGVDIACICKNANFLSGIACCLASACDTADQNAAVQYAINICKTGGVTNLPSAVSCTSSIASSTVSSSASAASVASSSSPTGTTTSPATATTTTTSHTSETSTASSSATASATKNASPRHFAGLGAEMCALAGLAAML